MKAAATEKLRRMREPRTELQKLELAQLTLTAIIRDGNKSWAMVRDESGMGYILKKGTAIGTMGRTGCEDIGGSEESYRQCTLSGKGIAHQIQTEGD